jgi:hypothetical protein
MMIDVQLPDDPWPFVVDTAIDMNNRPVNQKAKTSPLTRKVKLYNREPEPSLKRLRPRRLPVYS